MKVETNMTNIQSSFEYFVYIIFGPFLIFLGLFGNTMGLVVLNRKGLDKLGPKQMYKYLFIIDLACLVIVLNNHLIQSFGTGFQVLSQFTCKLYMYFAYTFSPLTPMILIYILVERYLSIKYPVESNFLRNKKIQFIYISILIVINILYFFYIPFISDLRHEETSNQTLCKIVKSKKISSYLVFFSRIFVPFVFVILFSILLVLKIINSRSNLSTFYSKRENLIFKKDVHLSILAILSNFIMICLNLPFYVIFFVMGNDNSVWYVFFLHVYHLSYVFYFYFFLITISTFRKEFFFALTNSKKKKTNFSLQLECNDTTF